MSAAEAKPKAKTTGLKRKKQAGAGAGAAAAHLVRAASNNACAHGGCISVPLSLRRSTCLQMRSMAIEEMYRSGGASSPKIVRAIRAGLSSTSKLQRSCAAVQSPSDAFAPFMNHTGPSFDQ